MSAFLNRDEIVQHLLRVLDDPDRVKVRKLKKTELPTLLDTLGKRVIDDYNLEDPNNPHTVLQHSPSVKDGYDESPHHPENFCMSIIEELWRKLQYTT